MNDTSVGDRVGQMAAKLHTLIRGDYQPFGAEGHRYRLNPPLTERQVAAFEGRHGVELPAEYRAFLTRVADGGVGPAYGMYSLAEALTKERRRGVPNDFLRTPFPHTQAYNPEKDPALKAFWERVEGGTIAQAEEERRQQYATAGTLVLCHAGCGYLHFLVVTGSARGQIWLDGTCSDQGYFSLGVGFFDWYEQWLDHTLAGGDGVWWMNGPGE